MRRMWVIGRREYRANVRSKAFVISLVMMPLLMAGSALAQRAMRGHVDIEPKRLAVWDGTGLLLPVLTRAAAERNAREIFDSTTGRQVEPRYQVEPVPWPNLDDQRRLELSEQIRKRHLHAFAEIGREVLAPARAPGSAPEVVFHSESTMSSDLGRWFTRTVNQSVQQQRLRAAGLDPELVRRTTAPLRVESLGLYVRDKKGEVSSGDRSSRDAAAVLPVAVMMLMFLAILMSQTMLHGTLEEKQQRIAEVLLGSVRPFELMTGKLMGGVATSLTMVGIYLVGGASLLGRYGYGSLLRNDLVVWVLLFLTVGVVIYGSIYAAVGAACSELKEAQNYLMPVIMVLMLPLMLLFKVMEEPMGNFATLLSFVPMWTPLLMPMRLAATSAVPLWQPILGLLGSMAAALLAAWAGGRVLRVGLLMQGKPPRLGQLVQWVLHG
jgi:ABC-2 type transport system permease protein